MPIRKSKFNQKPSRKEKTQEHLEMCKGTKFERRGVRISEVMGRVIFWRRMMKSSITLE